MTSMFPKDKFFNDQGVPLSLSLFVETARKGESPIFSLSIVPREGYVPLRDLFIESVTNDPTELTFAEMVFGDYAIWERMAQAEKLKVHIDKWREIAEVKRKCKAFTAVIKEIETGGNSAFTAAKYLIQEPWKTGKPTPSKKTTKQAAQKSSASSHLQRLQEEGIL